MGKNHLSVLASTVIAAISITCHAQVRVELKVHQSIGSTAIVSRYEGKNQIEVDSCKPTPDGVYTFSVPADTPKGIYKVSVGKGASFDFIVSTDTIVRFETYSFAVEDRQR